ncbi:hypothetical protein [Bartonella sp. HY761]|uniref:hypothetical protein n=1 Tax=Bartonella sp. HY761 TaxID=2979330 RepID=UPI002203BFC2|nr:hypothetical protein [Bartonella sp. HY761]UXN06840.1 hypothetical protein N6A79_02185 [Bartonella sp. HY761]
MKKILFSLIYFSLLCLLIGCQPQVIQPPLPTAASFHKPGVSLEDTQKALSDCFQKSKNNIINYTLDDAAKNNVNVKTSLCMNNLGFTLDKNAHIFFRPVVTPRGWW